jgi:hypothetical protein
MQKIPTHLLFSTVLNIQPFFVWKEGSLMSTRC